MPKKLKTLLRETQELTRYVKTGLPRETARVWLWTSQNAFLKEADPLTESEWKDRHGRAFGKGFTKTGNVESYLSYPKLRRTGRLLRGLKTKHQTGRVTLYNNVPYASEHEVGGASGGRAISGEFVKNGAKAVALGGRIQARPFMRPSREVLATPSNLLQLRMKKYGW